MSRSILITGASGFTGKHFITQAKKLGFSIIALSSNEEPICHADHQLTVDLTDKTAVLEALAPLEIDFVVHLAAISFVAHGDTKDIYNTNVVGTVNLLDGLIELNKNPTRVLVASSGNIYGNAKTLPIDEAMPFSPANDYAVSKCAMELAVSLRQNALSCIIVRPFNYTGVGQSSHFLVPKIVNAFKAKQPVIELGNLDVERDISDVRDVVKYYLALLCTALPDNQQPVVNICSGQSISLLAIIEKLQALTNHTIEVQINRKFVRDNEVKKLFGDNSKLKSLLGHGPSYQIEDTLTWMLNAPTPK